MKRGLGVALGASVIAAALAASPHGLAVSADGELRGLWTAEPPGARSPRKRPTCSS